MQKIIVMCLCVMLLVSTASARTVWVPQDNPVPILPPDAGDWNDPNNWDNGIPTPDEFGDPGDPENQTGKAVFFGTGKAECQVTTPDAVCFYFVLADNEEMDFALVIKDGGTLTAGNNWSSVAYNSAGGHIIVEEGGSLICGQHLWVGSQDGSVGTLDINGGYVRVNSMIGLGWSGTENTSTGYVNVNSGILSLANFNDTRSIGGNNPLNDDSRLDIRYGKVVFDGNHSGKLTDELADGRITGFGVIGNVNVDLVDGNTTLTSTHPMDPWPILPKDPPVPVGDVQLSWTNVDPNNPADSVWVDVWFGTDPNKLDLVHYPQVVVEGENTITVTVNAPLTGTYYWQVGSYKWGDPDKVVYDNDDPEAFHVIEGEVWSFDATNDLPPTAVNAGVDLITWSGKLTPMAATVDDDGESLLTYAWSADPADGAAFSATDVEVPSVTFAPRRTVVKGIQNQNYDAEEHINAQSPETDPGKLYGKVQVRDGDLELGSEGNSGRDWQVIAVQYDTLGIPQGANIISAKITFQIDNSGSARDENNFTILAELADDAARFDSDPNITGRARSAASVAWAPAAEPAQGSKLDTPDITALIQEVVDQAGWSEDNRLTLMIYPDVYLALPDPSTGGDTQVQEIEFEAGAGDGSATLSVMFDIPEGTPPAPGASTYTLTLAVNDEFNPTPVESTMTVDVYETPCYAAIAAGETANYIADYNGDCIINLADFAAMIAPYWADDYALTAPVPGP